MRLLLTLACLFGVGRLAAADTTTADREILASYLKVSAALAADDFATAKTSARAVADHAGDRKDIALKAAAVAKAEKIDVARQNFKALSAAVEPLAAGQKGYIVMYCPMAKADWVQTSPDVKNPYYGKSMLTCGGPKQAQ